MAFSNYSPHVFRFLRDHSKNGILKGIDLLREVFGFYKEYFNEKFENPVRKRHDQNSIVNHEALAQKKQQAQNRFISIEGIERFLAVFRDQANQNSDKKTYFLLSLFQLRTGTRIGEASAVRWEEIDWEAGMLKIDKTVQWMRRKSRPSRIRNSTKTDHPRMIKLIPELLKELKSLRASQGRISGLIFSFDGTTILTYRSIQHHYEMAFKSANVSFRSTHIMRHSFATAFAEMTQDMTALEGALGHSDPRQTRQYAKITENSVIRGMDSFARILEINATERLKT